MENNEVYTNNYENENENNEVAIYEEPKKSVGFGVVALIAAGCVGVGVLIKKGIDKITGKADMKTIAKLQAKGYTVLKPEVVLEESEVEEN